MEFVVGDALDNGQPDATYDLAWVMESSHLMADKPRLLRECARTLKPGGRLVLCDLFMLRPFTLEEVFAHRSELRCLDRAFGRARMEPPSAYAEWAEAAGLRVERHRDLTEETRPTLEAWATNAERHRATLQGLIGEAAVGDLVRACGILLGFWDDARMGYGLLTATRPA